MPVICPSDYMVQRLVGRKLVQPLDRAKLTNFANLDPALLNQKFDPGNAYSVPYFWGTTGLGYNRKSTGEAITSWAAAFDPKYTRKTLMLKDARECFAAALLSMGRSINETDAQVLRQAADRLKQQQMVEYAEARSCRWRYLLGYFGGDEEVPEVCGHCDRCAPERFG